jgi:16S rRNA (guanine527-N7)-methyltransferase
VPANPTYYDAFRMHLDHVARWNRTFNLVSRADAGRLWTRHLLDSLSIWPHVAAEANAGATRALDVGCGAGFPGLPLAVTLPSLSWQLVDRSARRIRFVELVVARLGLGNVTARCVDLESRDLPRSELMADIIVSRALAGPAALAALAGQLLAPGGVMLLQSATRAGQGDPRPVPLAPELGLTIERVEEIRVPGLDRRHELTIIRHAGVRGMSR